MIWASRPLRELLSISTPDSAAERALFKSAERDKLERLYQSDRPGLSSATLRARLPDGSLCRDRVTVQRFESEKRTFWTARHEITPAEIAIPPMNISRFDASDSSVDILHRMARVSELSARQFRPESSLAEVPAIFVPEMATWATVAMVAADGERWSMGSSIHESGQFTEQYDREVRTIHPNEMRDSDHVAILRGRIPYALVPQVTWKYLATHYPPEAAQGLANIGLASLVIAPICAGEDVTGLIVLARTAERPPFTEADVEIARLIGQRVGRQMRRVEAAWERKRHSIRIQNALLPELAPLPGFDIRTVYRPSAVHAHVGGDWFDAHPLGPDRFVLSVGDVCGHDAAAATTMARYRTTIRTFLWQGNSPEQALSLLDDLLACQDDFPVLATAIVALIDRSSPAAFRLTYSNAGHLSGVALLPEGDVVALDQGRGTPIGIPLPGEPRVSESLTLPYGSTIILFTDGVVEQRSALLPDRINDLHRLLKSLPPESPVVAIQDALLELNDPFRLEDDMCIVVARVTEPSAPRPGDDPR
jgi:serine phosphatase RsbU (regulator of sigma subunit)